MSPLEQSSEQIPQGAPSTLDAIVALSPDLGDQIHRYNKQISQLSDEQQRDLMERWKVEVQNGGANIGVFSSIVRNIRIQGISTKEVAVETKEVAVGAEKVAVGAEKVAVGAEKVAKEKEEKENKIRYEAALAAAGTAKEIRSRIGGKYTSEIEKRSSEDLQKPETQKYLATLGIVDVNNIPSEKKQVVQDILMARATTQVLLDNQTQILADNPQLQAELGKDFKNLNSLKFTLGLSGSSNVPGLPNLIPDQTKSDREAITSTVNSLTKGSPDTMITRTGDKLSFQDPKDDRYTYDIDIDKKPLVLTKKLGGLSISRELGETRDPIREKNDKTRAEITTLVRGLNEKKKEVLSSTMKDGSQVVSEGFSGVVSNTLSQLTLRDPAGADFSRKMLESGANVINMEKGRLEKLVTEKKAKDPLDSDIGAIQGAIREIDALIESIQRVRDKCIIQTEDPKNNHALWEKNTNDTLRTLVGLGFDELGQENLDALMRGISTRDNQHGIWQTGQLDMTDSFTMDKQLLDMRDIVTTLRKNSGKNERETMQDIGNSITKNEGFRNMWNNRSALSKWIQDQGNATTTKFAQNTVAGANSENR